MAHIRYRLLFSASIVIAIFLYLKFANRDSSEVLVQSDTISSQVDISYDNKHQKLKAVQSKEDKNEPSVLQEESENSVASQPQETDRFKAAALSWLIKIHTKSTEDQTNENLSTKFEMIQRLLPFLNLRKRLIDFQSGKSLTLTSSDNPEIRNLISSGQSSSLLFQEKKSIRDPRTQLDYERPFCELGLTTSIGNEKFGKKYDEEEVIMLVIDSALRTEDTYAGYDGVRVNFRTPTSLRIERSISFITCLTPSRSKEDDSYKLIELYHLLYTLGIRGQYD